MDLDVNDYLAAYQVWAQQIQERLRLDQSLPRAIFTAFADLQGENFVRLARIIRNIPIVVMPEPKVDFESSFISNPTLGFSLESGGPIVGTAGCFAERGEKTGITLPLHAIAPISSHYSNILDKKIYFQNWDVTAAIVAYDPVTDSAFAEFSSYDLLRLERVNIMAGQCPQGYQRVYFEGASSYKRIETYIDAWSKDLPFVEPYNQLKVYTPAVTNPGDSGSALRTEDDKVVGFAFYRTGIGQVPEFSAWIWAESVFRNLGLTMQ